VMNDDRHAIIKVADCLFTNVYYHMLVKIIDRQFVKISLLISGFGVNDIKMQYCCRHKTLTFI